MREIKFRAWDGKQMLFDITQWYIGERPETIGKYFLIDGYPLEALMQFTGIKDKNGVDIYEGDIIDFDFDGVIFVKNGYDVIFQDGAFLVNKPNFKPLLSDCSRIRVIGNIYSNPELINQ